MSQEPVKRESFRIGISGWGTVCGSLNGACVIITLVAGPAYGQITNELMAWYGTTRCARLTGDVTAKVAQLLNAHFAGTLVTGEFEKSECASCHFMGENYESGQIIIGKGTNCTDCHGSEPHAGT